MPLSGAFLLLHFSVASANATGAAHVDAVAVVATITNFTCWLLLPHCR